MKAQIRQYNGTPTLFLDDRPVFAGIHLLIAQNVKALAKDQVTMAAYAEAGIHIYAVDTVGPHWPGPRLDQHGFFDYSTAGPRLREILAVDPQALFLLRMGFETNGLPGDWWNQMFPEEMELLSDGRRVSQSPASSVWQAQVKESIKGLIDQLRTEGLYEHVIAYQVLTGSAGEWVKGESSMGLICGDYSEPMLRYFRRWLRQRYHDDPAILQAAWGEAQVTFETAEVPTSDEQFFTNLISFRDPVHEQKTIDFYMCYADMSASALLNICQFVKQETGGEKLTGAFFGYLMELAWNVNFFVEIPNLAGSQVSTLQRSGHLGLRKLLRSPDIDFFVSPYGYAFRGLGGDGLPMQPAESLRAHGKLYLMEEDTTMHNNFDPNGRNQRTQDSIAVYHRNFAQCLTHGQGITWLEDSLFPHPEEIVEEAHRWLRRYQALGEWSLQFDRSPQSEVAVLLDDESFYYQSIFNNLDTPLIWQQRVVNLNRFGAPHDVYLLDDLLEDRLPEYKLYIFLNAFHLDNSRRKALKQILRREGKVALWLYAPGCLNSDAVGEGKAALHVDHMHDLTGLNFGRGDSPWGPFMHILDFDHPITQGLPQDLFWGSTAPIGPLFHLDDPQATILGQVVYSLGRCQPGFGLRTFNQGQNEEEWTSVYVATPNVPAPVLRGIARYAGVHLYSEAGDVLYATPELLSVHTTGGGQRLFRLPQQVEVVYDLFHEQVIAHNADKFEVVLPKASTALYYTGKAGVLAGLGNPIEAVRGAV
jgi:hypothetical protein